jgi:hypothetical protein
MVNSRSDEAMNGIENLREQVGSIERKLESLAVSVDTRFEQIDAALVEQREYTEFAFNRLRTEMHDRFGRVERKLDQFIDTQTRTNDLVDRRLTRLESKYD